MFLLLPIGNSDSRVRRLPWATLTIIGLCVLVQLWGMFVYLRAVQFQAQNVSMDPVQLEAALEQIMSYHPVERLGYVPSEHGPLRVLTAAFVHGGWMHLIGNMFFLYTVGCNVEDRWGRGPFVALYIAGALLSGWTFGHFHPELDIGLVGASGAVSAVMGAFIVHFFFSRICFFWFFWYFMRLATGSFSWPAWAAIGLWALLQFGLAYLETRTQCVSVAYTAHAGGFVFGLLVGLGLRFSGLDKRLDEKQQARFDGAEPTSLFEADPRTLEATQLLATSPAQAIALFGAVVAERPNDEAVRHLLDALESYADGPTFDRHIGALLGYARTQRNEKLANAIVRVAVDKRAEMALSDLDWAFVVTSARAVRDAQVVVFATGKMAAQHPQSRYLPKALFETAMAQREAGRADLAQKTLRRLVSQHGDSPFAARAHAELG